MYDTSISEVTSNIDCIPKISTSACRGSYDSVASRSRDRGCETKS